MAAFPPDKRDFLSDPDPRFFTLSLRGDTELAIVKRVVDIPVGAILGRDVVKREDTSMHSQIMEIVSKYLQDTPTDSLYRGYAQFLVRQADLFGVENELLVKLEKLKTQLLVSEPVKMSTVNFSESSSGTSSLLNLFRRKLEGSGLNFCSVAMRLFEMELKQADEHVAISPKRTKEWLDKLVLHINQVFEPDNILRLQEEERKNKDPNYLFDQIYKPMMCEFELSKIQPELVEMVRIEIKKNKIVFPEDKYKILKNGLNHLDNYSFLYLDPFKDFRNDLKNIMNKNLSSEKTFEIIYAKVAKEIECRSTNKTLSSDPNSHLAEAWKNSCQNRFIMWDEIATKICIEAMNSDKNFEETFELLGKSRQELAFENFDTNWDDFGVSRKPGFTADTAFLGIDYFERFNEHNLEVNLVVPFEEGEVPIPITTYIYPTFFCMRVSMFGQFTGIMMNHMHSSEFPELIPKMNALYNELMHSPLSETEWLKKVAKFHWWLAHMMPLCRGSASCAEVLVKTMFKKARGINIVWIKENRPDVEALLRTNPQDFIDMYEDCYVRKSS